MTPVLGERVMIDPSAVVMGDVVWVMTSAFGRMRRCAVMCK
jgi:carbonic anhydrase/acetyltransferase-like protein (isoleucine patch superfamily)